MPNRRTPVNPNPREKTSVTDQLVRLIRQAGGKSYKTHGGPMSSGQPDLFACLFGYMVVVETKRPGEANLTERQQENLRRWGKAGAIALGANNAEEAMLNILRTVVKRDQEISEDKKEQAVQMTYRVLKADECPPGCQEHRHGYPWD